MALTSADYQAEDTSAPFHDRTDICTQDLNELNHDESSRSFS